MVMRVGGGPGGLLASVMRCTCSPELLGHHRRHAPAGSGARHQSKPSSLNKISRSKIFIRSRLDKTRRLPASSTLCAHVLNFHEQLHRLRTQTR